MWDIFKKILGACVKKSQTTAGKTVKWVGGSGGLLAIILALHSDIKAEIKDQFALSQENANIKIAAVTKEVENQKTAVDDKFDSVQKAQDERFKAVQQTINLKVEAGNNKIQAIQSTQRRMLDVLNKLDQRLYDMNKKQNGG